MKLITFAQNDTLKPGILTPKGIIDIEANWPGPNPPRSIKQILNLTDDYPAQLRQLEDSCKDFLKTDSVSLAEPIPQPDKILAMAGNYRKHIIEAGMKLGLSEAQTETTVPRPFIMPPTVITGPEATIPWPAYSRQIDYEAELAIVIGRTAKQIAPDEALNYIAGYTIANDISARSVTFTKSRSQRPWDEFYDWLNGKWADGFLPIGPAITTSDEIKNPQNLNICLRVNGQTRQNANTKNMIHSVSQIVSFLSNLMTLSPGDIIATGTPEGVGMADGNFLSPGDKIEAEIEKIGKLQNTLGEKPDKFYEPLSENSWQQ